MEVDPEVTPPPHEPPQLIPDNLPIELRDHLVMITERLTDVTQGLRQVWGSRKDSEHLERIESKIGTLAEYATKHQTMLHEFVMPGIKECLSSTDRIDIQFSKITTQLEAVSMLLNRVDTRLRELEGQLVMANERFNSKTEAIEIRMDHSEEQLTRLDNRLDKLERVERDREVIAKTLAKQERKKSGAIGATVGAVAAIITEIISHIVK